MYIIVKYQNIARQVSQETSVFLLNKNLCYIFKFVETNGKSGFFLHQNSKLMLYQPVNRRSIQ